MGFLVFDTSIVARTDLSASAKLLYHTLGNASGSGGSVWAGCSYLANATKISDGTVKRATKELEKAGLVTVERERRSLLNPSENLPNRYTLPLWNGFVADLPVWIQQQLDLHSIQDGHSHQTEYHARHVHRKWLQRIEGVPS